MEESSKSTTASNDLANGTDVAVQSQLESCTVKNSHNPGFCDWQSTKMELKERFEYIFNSRLYGDVHFIVGSGTATERISAHRLVLTVGSVVFETMFSETWSDDCGDNEIEIPDVKPAAFKELLKFIYSDKVLLTADTVMEIMYIAKKYAVRALELKCADFLEDELCPENAFTLLIQARFFDVTKLTKACLDVIGNHTIDTLETDDFCNIDAETLCLVLDQSDLMINEMALFEAVIRWSKAACEKQNLPINPQNQRSVLKNAVSFLRFPSMSHEDFASKVVDSGLLLEKEIISVLLYIVKKSAVCDGFSKTPRRSLYVLKRFETESNDKSFTGSHCHSVNLSVDRDILMLGFGLFGSPSKPAKCEVELALKDDEYVCPSCDLHLDLWELEDGDCPNCGEYCSPNTSIQESGVYDCSKKIYRVMLKEPVRLTAAVRYNLTITIQGDYSLYGTGGQGTITINLPPDEKVNFSFVDADSEQIPEIIFKL